MKRQAQVVELADNRTKGNIGEFEYIDMMEYRFLEGQPSLDRYAFNAGVIEGKGGMQQRLLTCYKATGINFNPSGLAGKDFTQGFGIVSATYHIGDCSVLLQRRVMNDKSKGDYDWLDIIGMDDSRREATLKVLEEAFN